MDDIGLALDEPAGLEIFTELMQQGIAGLEIVDDPARDPVRKRLPAARAARNEQNVFHRGLLELRAARAAESSSVLDDSFMYHLREKKGRRNG